MAIIHFPSSLRKFVNHQENLTIPGGKLSEILCKLVVDYPQLKTYLLDNDNNVYHFINLYVNGQDIRFLNNLNTQIEETDSITIIPAIAGG